MLIFGERLKELREEKNMTQEELSSYLNVTRQSISGYETGSSEPVLENLVIISKIFNVSIDYLLGLTKDRYNINALDKRDKAMVYDFIKLLEKHKEKK